MSGEKRQNLSGEEPGSDDKRIENVEIEIRTTDLDNTVEVPHNLSDVTDNNLQHYAAYGTIEVDPSDIIMVEELSHKSLGQSSSESLNCTVVYEFPSDYENENVSHLSQACVDNKDSTPCNKTSSISDHDEYRTFLQMRENQEKNMFDTTESIAGTSDGTERKRKVSISSLQNKRYKEVESLYKPVIQLSPQRLDDIVQVKHLDYASDNFADIEDNTKDTSSSDNGESNSSSNTVKKVLKNLDSDEFADVEDNAKDSSSSDNSESDSTIKTAKKVLQDLDSGEFADVDNNAKDSSSSHNSESDSTSKTVKKVLQDFDSDMQSRNEYKFKSRDASQSSKTNNDFGSNSQSSENNTIVDNPAEKNLLASSIKGKTVLLNIFPNEINRKFELPTGKINEVPELQSGQQTYQSMQSKTNPLKMKNSVVKRKDKCNICNAKLGLCAIRCRCGGYYCAKHRYDKEHNCTFDYKSMGAEEIRKNNPRITAEKIRKL